MAIINRDNRFMDLIRAIKGSKLQPTYKNILLKYILDVKAKRRNNDFIDDEFLERLMLELVTEYTNNGREYNLNDLIESVKIIFPFGENTENYENLRELFISQLAKYNHLFNEKLFALFDDKKDYVDIVNIIFGNEYYEDYCDEIFLWGADYYAEFLPNKNEGSWIVWDKRSNEDTQEEYVKQTDKMFGSCFELCWSKNKLRISELI